MKIKNIALTIITSMLFLFIVFVLVNGSRKEVITVASAHNLAGKSFTPTPFATSVPEAVIQIMQQYAYSKILTRTVHGVEMSAANFRIENGILMADVCFQKPDNKDWEALDVRARFGNTEVGAYQTITFDKVTTQQNGEQSQMTFLGNPPQVEMKTLPPNSFAIDYRCETEKMRLEPEATPSHIVLTVYNIMFTPSESQGCSYLDEIQSILDAKGTGVKLDCTKSKGYDRVSIREKPGNMSQEDANVHLGEASRDVFRIQGPWVFEGEVMNLTDSAVTIEPVATEFPVEATMPPEEVVTPTP